MVTRNKLFTTINRTLLKRAASDIKFIVIHYVGALGDAKANAQYYASQYVGASADFFVGFAGDIWQGNDYYTGYAWHCGGGFQSSLSGGGSFYQICTNKNSVGIEMCVKKKSSKTMNATDKDWYFEDATVNATAKLVAELMHELNIDIDHVIRHFDVNKKICPNPFVYDTGKYTWASFKKLVQSYLGQAEQVPVIKCYGVPSSKEAFIEAVGFVANNLMAETGILASVVTAQCCLETGYGLGSDALVLTKVNNLLGMKVDLINNTWKDYTVWKGGSITKKTPEVYNGKQTYITDHFRTYSDYEECIRDYEMFLLHVQNNKGLKYARIAGMTDPAAVIHVIRIGTGTDAKPEGYATDPSYETKVLKIIQENNLTRFDTRGEEVATGNKKKLLDEFTSMDKLMREDIKAKKYWTYNNKNTAKQSKTFAEARKNNNRKVNCVSAVYWGLIGSGVVNSNRDGIQWYGSKGVVFLSEKDKKNALKYFTLVTSLKGKTVKAALNDGSLKPLDIVTYKTLSHTNVYLGDGKWFDSGHANCLSQGEGAKFSKWICDKAPYANYQIAEILRLKEPAKTSTTTAKKTEYRVQSGAYKTKGNAVKRSNVLTGKGIVNKVELINGNYVVQLGRYSSKASAEKFAKDVAKKYKIEVSVEKM